MQCNTYKNKHICLDPESYCALSLTEPTLLHPIFLTPYHRLILPGYIPCMPEVRQFQGQCVCVVSGGGVADGTVFADDAYRMGVHHSV